MRRLLTILGTLTLLGGMATAAAVTGQPAHASGLTVCGFAGENGNGDCMNNWSLSGAVYAFTPGNTNEEFGFVPVDRCSGGDTVTSTCPFSDTGKDGALRGKEIEQGVYAGGSTAVCVGIAGSNPDPAWLVGCNNPNTGTGGGKYTVFVVAGNDTLVSVGCTNADGAWCQLEQAPNRSQDYFEGLANATEWTNVP